MGEYLGRDSRKTVKDLKLGTLLEITNAINDNLPEDKLFILLEVILQEQLNIGRAVIFLNQLGIWRIVMQYGVQKEDLKINIEEQLEKVTDITVLDTSRVGSSHSFDVVIPILHQSKPLAYLMLGDLDEDARKPSPIIKHLGFIQTLANITVVAVENKRLEKEFLQQERLKQELRMASRMQEMLLPKVLPDNDVLQVAAFYRPHLEVGGDFYDVVNVSPHETVICVADVSGKGLSAAILMANFQAHLRANVKVESDLETVMRNLNEVVWENANGDRFVTCFLARYDHRTRVLESINAAHPPALLAHEGSCIVLNEGCVGLGMFESIPEMQVGKLTLNPSDIMVCFTDGISETTNEEGDQYEEVGVIKSIHTCLDMECSGINDKIMKDLDAYRGTMHYADDVALVSCRFF